jgi:cobalt/nickel transport system ATP-binding protein
VIALSVRGLCFHYPDGREALRGVDLEVAAGERVALVGPNGAGKSTLMLHLNGVLRGQGDIAVCGTSLSDSTLAAVRADVGLVFQDADDQLFCPTVFEDVAFGPMYLGLPRDEVRARASEALRAVGMADAADRPPHHLSGGEKRRVAIATVLSMRPRLLVLDEPSAGLDPRARRELIDLLRGMPQTLLVATHDLALAQDLLPRTVVMDGGRIAASGATSDILADAALLERHGLR